MSTSITGGCSCGALRYTISAAPVVAFNCHCRACQHYTGSAYMPGSMFPKSAFTLESGTPTWYQTVGDNGGTIRRGFCGVCGSPVCTELDRIPHVIGIPASSMDDPSNHKPTMDLFTAHAQPWDCMNPALTKYKLSPPPRS